MNKPSTLFTSLVLLALLTVTTLITLIAYSPTFNRPFARMLGMAHPLPGPFADVVLGQDDFTQSVTNRSLSTGLYHPSAIAIDQSVDLPLVWVADSENHRVLGFFFSPYLGPGSTPDFVVGQPDLSTTEPSAGRGGLNTPVALAVDGRGGLVIADRGNNRVVHYDRPFDEASVADRVFGQTNWDSSSAGSELTQLSGPSGVAVDAAGNLFIADTGNHRILRFAAGDHDSSTPDRIWSGDEPSNPESDESGILPGPAGMRSPTGLSIRRDGLLAVADTANNRILLFESDREEDTTVMVIGGRDTIDSPHPGDIDHRLNSPQGVAFHAGGLTVSDTGNHRIVHYPQVDRSVVKRVWGGVVDSGDMADPTNATFNSPAGVAVDDQGNLFVADRGNNRVLIFLR